MFAFILNACILHCMDALNRAIATAPSQRAFADLVGVTPALLSMWKSRGEVPPRHVLAVERASRGQVSRYEIRPDLYGDPA